MLSFSTITPPPTSPPFFFLMIPRPPRSPLFPYTTLFRPPRTPNDPHSPTPPPPTTDTPSTPHHHSRSAPSRYSPPNSTDRKSTRLNSSHQITSYAVFCLKKKPNRSSRSRVRTSRLCARRR